MWTWLERRLRIIETNYGRNAGWFVERHGRCVAILKDVSWVEMLWDGYAVEWVTDDLQERQDLLADDPCLWHGDHLQYRNREFDEVIEGALVSGPPLAGRIEMRGLYLRASPPWFWVWPLLWWRGRLNRKGRIETDCQ